MEELAAPRAAFEACIAEAQRGALPRVSVRVLTGTVTMGMPEVPQYSVKARPIAHATARLLSSRPTAIAAPKPLSMFTTVTPEAQLVSMPSIAVNPARAVP